MIQHALLRHWRADLMLVLILFTVSAAAGTIAHWNLVFSTLTGTLPAGSDAVAAAPEDNRPLGAQQVNELLTAGKALAIDARRPFFFEKERIAGAVSLPIVQFEQRISEFSSRVDRERLLIIYCSGYGCEDSQLLADKLQQAGYRRIKVFHGGMPEWKQGGFPIEGTDSEVR